jgi:uridine kinase
VNIRFITAFPILFAAAKMPEKSVSVITVDGKSASGKTTLARQLSSILEAEVIHMDDFFLPLELRTPSRLAEPGGNVHYERFKTEVLPELKQKKSFSYRRFDCSKMRPGEMRKIAISRWRIVEGAYSLHPEFGDYADLKVFFDISPAEIPVSSCCDAPRQEAHCDSCDTAEQPHCILCFYFFCRCHQKRDGIQ